MASIYKRSRDKKRLKRPPYYIDYTDHTGVRRTVKGYTDKALTVQLAAKLEHEAKLRRDGLVDADEENRRDLERQPIANSLSLFEKALMARGNSEKHVQLTISRTKRLLDGAGATTLRELTAEKVQDFLHHLTTEKGCGPRTHNHYVQAANSFCRWLV